MKRFESGLPGVKIKALGRTTGCRRAVVKLEVRGRRIHVEGPTRADQLEILSLISMKKEGHKKYKHLHLLTKTQGTRDG